MRLCQSVSQSVNQSVSDSSHLLVKGEVLSRFSA